MSSRTSPKRAHVSDVVAFETAHCGCMAIGYTHVLTVLRCESSLCHLISYHRM